MVESATKPVSLAIRTSQLEIEFEGDPEFLLEHLDSLVSAVSKDRNLSPIAKGENYNPLSSHQPESPPIQMTTANIAAKLSAKSGSDMVMAAAAKLLFVNKSETFKRPELLIEMKSAPSYYKESHRKNLTPSLDTLIKTDQLREVSDGTYAISARTAEQLKSQLV